MVTRLGLGYIMLGLLRYTLANVAFITYVHNVLLKWFSMYIQPGELLLETTAIKIWFISTCGRKLNWEVIHCLAVVISPASQMQSRPLHVNHLPLLQSRPLHVNHIPLLQSRPLHVNHLPLLQWRPLHVNHIPPPAVEAAPCEPSSPSCSRGRSMWTIFPLLQSRALHVNHIFLLQSRPPSCTIFPSCSWGRPHVPSPLLQSRPLLMYHLPLLQSRLLLMNHLALLQTRSLLMTHLALLQTRPLHVYHLTLLQWRPLLMNHFPLQQSKPVYVTYHPTLLSHLTLQKIDNNQAMPFL